MSVRGSIMGRTKDGEWKEILPFVGRSPEIALTAFMKKGFSSVRFQPHKKEVDGGRGPVVS